MVDTLTDHRTDKRLPWPARVQESISGDDLMLLEQARKAHPGVSWWWNQRPDGRTYGAWCYLCECHVATWARRWPVTMSAIGEVMRHRQMHLDARPRVRV